MSHLEAVRARAPVEVHWVIVTGAIILAGVRQAWVTLGQDVHVYWACKQEVHMWKVRKDHRLYAYVHTHTFTHSYQTQKFPLMLQEIIWYGSLNVCPISVSLWPCVSRSCAQK